MAVNNKCDYTATVEYGFRYSFCPVISQTINWTQGTGGYYCTNPTNTNPSSFILTNCFVSNNIYKLVFNTKSVTQGSIEIFFNGNSVLTISESGKYEVIFVGLSPTGQIEIVPSGFEGCFSYQTFRAATDTSDYPYLTGLSINGQYTYLSTPISFDPSISDIKDYFQSLGYNVNILQSDFFTTIHFSQTEDTIDYITINYPLEEYRINFEKFNCPDFFYEKWQCCLSSIVEQMYKAEKYNNCDTKFVDKINYITQGINILKRKNSNCLTNEENRKIERLLDSLCCSPCPQDNQVVKYLENPPPSVNRCTSVPSFILRSDNSFGQICYGSSVTLYVDTSVYYNGLIYTFEQSTDGGLTWVPAAGNQPYSKIPLFNTDPITQPIIYRLVVSCEYTYDDPKISNEISFSLIENPIINITNLTGLPACSGYANIILECTDLGVGSSYYWIGPNGFTSVSRVPLINLDNYGPGIYQVQATTSSGCQSVASFQVNSSDILPTFEIEYTVTEDDGTGNGKINILITNYSEISDLCGPNYLIDWVTNNDYPNTNTYEIINLPAGNYTIRLVTECGCESSYDITVPLI